MATVGTNDPTISDHLKAFIQTPDALIVGIIGEGSSRELTALWESPFENDTPGSMFSKVGGILQAGHVGGLGEGQTSKSTLNTTQVWSGTTPHNFNLVLEFYATSDAYSQVQAAIIELEKAVAPEMNEVTPGGRIPPQVSLNAGRQIIWPHCVITNVSRPLDGPIGRDGYPLEGSVTIQLQTFNTVNQSDIPATFG
ncbi:hypothetical protein [Vreelandella alkaliphila]|uniref:Uncharacterized protein n=1 Tax=Vreelandella alkaliphila TaxID=272774 RepID=A0AAJ2VRE1_9GAMM|nr:hypothetical protein [Halomonas alkaliphila]MDX5979648.1 hypothetical protein [Halomonas alkaliphila]